MKILSSFSFNFIVGFLPFWCVSLMAINDSPLAKVYTDQELDQMKERCSEVNRGALRSYGFDFAFINEIKKHPLTKICKKSLSTCNRLFHHHKLKSAVFLGEGHYLANEENKTLGDYYDDLGTAYEDIQAKFKETYPHSNPVFEYKEVSSKVTRISGKASYYDGGSTLTDYRVYYFINPLCRIDILGHWPPMGGEASRALMRELELKIRRLF